jgi:hypothetical protein
VEHLDGAVFSVAVRRGVHRGHAADAQQAIEPPLAAEDLADAGPRSFRHRILAVAHDPGRWSTVGRRTSIRAAADARGEDFVYSKIVESARDGAAGRAGASS